MLCLFNAAVAPVNVERWCPVPEIRGILLRSKWAAGKAVRAGLADGGSISEAIRDRRATQPPAHCHRNPLGRGQVGGFPRCSLDPYDSEMGASPPVRLGPP